MLWIAEARKLAFFPSGFAKRRLSNNCPIDLPKYHSENVQYKKKMSIDNGDHMETSNPGSRGSRKDGKRVVSRSSRRKYASMTLMIM